MTLPLNDYFASPAFDPGIMAARAWQAERHLWFNNVHRNEVSVPDVRATYEAALPVIGYSLPTPNLYSTTIQSLFDSDFDRPRTGQQQLLDALGIASLQRAPSLAPLWSELSARGGGFVTPSVWGDFRRSSLFEPTTQTLAMTARTTMRQASRLVGRAVAKGGRYTLKAAGWLLNVPNPTPMGVGIAIVKEVGVQVGLDLAQRGWKGVLSYLRNLEDEQPPPPPLPGPWPPTAPPSGYSYWPGSGGARLLMSAEMPANQPSADFEFLAFQTTLGEDAPPFLATVDGPREMPPHLMAVGCGLYR